MNNKSIGNIGEAKALAKFVEYGFPVFIPFGENEKADMIVEFNNKLNRIQVKTSFHADQGKMIFDLTSNRKIKNNYIRRKYEQNEIDYFVCYNVLRNKLYLIPIEDIQNKSNIVIRYYRPKINNLSRVRKEYDYLFDNAIKRILKKPPK